MDKKNKVTLAQLSGRHDDLKISVPKKKISADKNTINPVHKRLSITSLQELPTKNFSLLTGLIESSTQAIAVVDKHCAIEFMNSAAALEFTCSKTITLAEEHKFHLTNTEHQAFFCEQVALAASSDASKLKPVVFPHATRADGCLRVFPLTVGDDKKSTGHVVICISQCGSPLFDHQLTSRSKCLSVSCRW